VRYRSLLLAWLHYALAIGGLAAFLVYMVAPTAAKFSWLKLLGILFFGFMTGWLVLVAWRLCFHATLDGDLLTFRRLGRTRRANLADVSQIATYALANDSKAFYLIQFTDKKKLMIVNNKTGTRFVNAIVQAPRRPIQIAGWEPIKNLEQ
jgi:hypothetical protein